MGAATTPFVPPGEFPDRGGVINTITPHNITSKNATGMAVSSFLVEVGEGDRGADGRVESPVPGRLQPSP